jgi:hypothetical protein
MSLGQRFAAALNPQPKPLSLTRQEQIRGNECESVSRAECKLSDVAFLLDLVKPAGGARGHYEILRQDSGSLAVVVRHDVCEPAETRALYGAGNESQKSDGYGAPEIDGQRNAMMRTARGLASAEDLAVIAAKVARLASAIGDGAAGPAESRILALDEFTASFSRILTSLETEQSQINWRRAVVATERESRANSEAARLAERQAIQAAKAKALREEALANTTATLLAQAEMKAIREQKAAQERIERERAEAAEKAEHEAIRAKHEHMKAEAERLAEGR